MTQYNLNPEIIQFPFGSALAIKIGQGKTNARVFVDQVLKTDDTIDISRTKTGALKIVKDRWNINKYEVVAKITGEVAVFHRDACNLSVLATGYNEVLIKAYKEVLIKVSNGNDNYFLVFSSGAVTRVENMPEAKNDFITIK